MNTMMFVVVNVSPFYLYFLLFIAQGVPSPPSPPTWPVATLEGDRCTKYVTSTGSCGYSF
jgi:hypothetical protein